MPRLAQSVSGILFLVRKEFDDETIRKYSDGASDSHSSRRGKSSYNKKKKPSQTPTRVVGTRPAEKGPSLEIRMNPFEWGFFWGGVLALISGLFFSLFSAYFSDLTLINPRIRHRFRALVANFLDAPVGPFMV